MKALTDPPTRLKELEDAIRLHREEKSSVPDCTCWVSQAQKLDTLLYGCLDGPGTVLERIAVLEAAIQANRLGKQGIPDCPCWGNAPQLVDGELFKCLE